MRRALLRWSAWWLLLGIVSWALLSPYPPRAGAALLPPWLTFAASKAVHLVSYATLSALVIVIPAGRGTWIVLWLLLAVHGAATEFLQRFVEGRHGVVTDVVINWTGLGLGLVLVWCASRRRPPG